MGTETTLSVGAHKLLAPQEPVGVCQLPIPTKALHPGLERLTGERDERSLRVGVVSGLGYTNLRGDLERTTAFLRENPQVPHRIVKNREDVAAALDVFVGSNINLIVVSGGDGTVSMVATDLLARESLRSVPALAVLRGGRTNMTAADVGLKGDQIRNLQRVLAYAENPRSLPARFVERPVIGISSPGKAERCGFFVGAGAIYQGSLATWKFREQSHVPGMRTGFGTAASVVKLVSSHLISRTAFAPSRMGVQVDGTSVQENTWCAVFATTLSRLAFGLKPFWGSENGQIRLTGVAHDHQRLIRAAGAAFFGRRTKSLGPTRGYHSHNAKEVAFELSDGVTLDGEIITPEIDRLQLRVAGSLRFLQV